MFSMSMIASSTTTPTEITNPASTIVLIVAPVAVEDERGCHQREGDRGEADDGRPPLEEEGDEDEHHEQRPEQQGVGQVRDRDLDELGGPEDVVVDVDPRQARPHLVERLVDPARDVERVRPRELLDHHQEALVVVDDRVAEERLVAPRHRAEVAELERRPVGAGACPTP